jgi:hypothetical protein
MSSVFNRKGIDQITWSKTPYRLVKLYHPIGSLVAVGDGVAIVLSCSRTPWTARFHNCRLRAGLWLELPWLMGLFGDDKDSLGWGFAAIGGERTKNIS